MYNPLYIIYNIWYIPVVFSFQHFKGWLFLSHLDFFFQLHESFLRWLFALGFPAVTAGGKIFSAATAVGFAGADWAAESGCRRRVSGRWWAWTVLGVDWFWFLESWFPWQNMRQNRSQTSEYIAQWRCSPSHFSGVKIPIFVFSKLDSPLPVDSCFEDQWVPTSSVTLTFWQTTWSWRISPKKDLNADWIWGKASFWII